MINPWNNITGYILYMFCCLKKHTYVYIYMYIYMYIYICIYIYVYNTYICMDYNDSIWIIFDLYPCSPLACDAVLPTQWASLWLLTLRLKGPGTRTLEKWWKFMGFSQEDWSFNGISPNIGIEWDGGEIPWRNWQTHQETAGAMWLKKLVYLDHTRHIQQTSEFKGQGF